MPETQSGKAQDPNRPQHSKQSYRQAIDRLQAINGNNNNMNFSTEDKQALALAIKVLGELAEQQN